MKINSRMNKKPNGIDDLIIEFFKLAFIDVLSIKTSKKNKLSALLLIEDFEPLLNDLGLSESFTSWIIKKGRENITAKGDTAKHPKNTKELYHENKSKTNNYQRYKRTYPTHTPPP